MFHDKPSYEYDPIANQGSARRAGPKFTQESEQPPNKSVQVEGCFRPEYMPHIIFVFVFLWFVFQPKMQSLSLCGSPSSHQISLIRLRVVFVQSTMPHRIFKFVFLGFVLQRMSVEWWQARLPNTASSAFRRQVPPLNCWMKGEMLALQRRKTPMWMCDQDLREQPTAGLGKQTMLPKTRWLRRFFEVSVGQSC